MEKMSVYLVNLARYNSDEITGAWFTLPLDPENVRERLQLSDRESEYAVHDTDNFPFDIEEYVSLEELNRIYYQVEELPDWMIGGLREAVSICGSLGEVVEAYEDGRFWFYEGVHDVTELAYYLIDECGALGEIPDALCHYIDYEAFGRDFAIEHILFDVSGGICVYE